MEKFIIKPSHDKPINDVVLLGHDKIVKHLKKFIESGRMITPISIAIHGEWGSGKTSIMRTLDKKLSEYNFQTIFFEPWRYENADPPLALAQIIANTLYNTEKKELAKELVVLAANSISKKFLGIEIKDLLEYVDRNTKAVAVFSHKLEKAIRDNLSGKKLVIIIDDLDRCDVENTLLILAIMKLFLEIENCICIAAVDFKRLQQAWRAKYQTENDSDNGREYLEKIFQIRIGLSVPSSKEIIEYVNGLVPNMPDSILTLFGNVGPKNPRAIKRLLNLISYRASLLNSDSNYISATLWTILEYIIDNKQLIHFCYELSRRGNSLGNFIAHYGGNWTEIKGIVYSTPDLRETSIIDPLLQSYFMHSQAVSASLGVGKKELETDFVTLYASTNEVVRL